MRQSSSAKQKSEGQEIDCLMEPGIVMEGEGVEHQVHGGRVASSTHILTITIMLVMIS